MHDANQPDPPVASGNLEPEIPTEITAEQQRAVGSRLEQWKKSLLDLSRVNKLLFFNTSRRTRLCLTLPKVDVLYEGLLLRDKEFTFAVPKGVDVALAELGMDGGDDQEQERRGDISIDYDKSSATDVKSLQQKLFRLHSDARTVLNEQGINTLHLALGILRWRETDSSPDYVDSPILLVPVSLEREKNSPYRLKAFEGDVVVNPTLTHKLKHDFGYSLPSFDEFDGFGESPNVPGYFGLIRDQVMHLDWEVAEDAWLSHFSFEKLVMYEDLNQQNTLIEMIEHSVLGPICEADELDVPEVNVEDIDRTFDLPETYPVIEADSSQLEVMARVRGGQSLVVQGPPGTGKSQTIVNLIGQALREGKKVLFVSEKRAALEVVHKRLESVGLSHLCLELHSHRANKRQVVHDLHKAMVGAQRVLEAPSPEGFEDRQRLRDDLDAHTEAVHKPRSKGGLSVFDVQGKLAHLLNAPNLQAPLPVDKHLEHDHEAQQRLLSALRDVMATKIWEQQDAHPWRDAKIPYPPPEAETRLMPHIAGLIGLINQISSDQQTWVEVSHILDVQNISELPRFVKQLELLRNIPSPLPELWLTCDEEQFFKTNALIEEALDKNRKSRKLMEEIELQVSTKSLQKGHRGTIHELMRHYLTTHASMFARLQGEYRTDKKLLTSLTEKKMGYAQACSFLRKADEWHDLTEWLERHERELAETTGRVFPLDPAPEQSVAQALAWASSFRETLKDGRISSAAADAIRHRANEVMDAAARNLASLHQQIPKVTTHIQSIDEAFPSGFDGISSQNLNFDALVDRLQATIEQRDLIYAWTAYERALVRCEESGLGPFLLEARAEKVSNDQLERAYLRRYYTDWLLEVYRDEEHLATFDPSIHESKIRQFSQLDKNLHRSARDHALATASITQEVVRQAAAFQDLSRGRHRYVPDREARDEYKLIKKEFNKKTRHIPLRRLLPDVPKVLSTVKPCLLMSPLSVASYLPRDRFKFDLVIFDEASQVLPADAIGAILRGKQLVVMGDTKQLPPTSFFQKQMDDDTDVPEEEDVTSFESILEIAAGSLPSTSLLWHYRSRDERLIAFSNRRFYDGNLITFPSVDVGRETGVEFHHVADGCYESGGSKVNQPEARSVVDQIINHWKTFDGERSLGVIALSLSQRDAIELELARRLIASPELEHFRAEERDEPFFVKNLETVQGDERDHIIISIGYGPKEPGGPPSLVFGPVNWRGGERRLNVAVTRSKYKTSIFASMRPEQLDGVQNARWEGPRVLAEYLRYAARGGRFETEGTSDPTALPESDFEIAVRNAIVGAGYQVDYQVGSSGFRIDLAVVHPDFPSRYILGIECDGVAYHSSRGARDRDRLRQEILESQGWAIHRIWSTDWVRHPQLSLRRVVERIEELRHESSVGIRRIEDSSPPPTPAFEADPPLPPDPPGNESFDPSENGHASETVRLTADFLTEQKNQLLFEGDRVRRQIESFELDKTKLSDKGLAEASISRTLGDRLKLIDTAVERLNQNRYGQCDGCSGAIEVERLEAVPWTAWCRDCSTRHD